MKSGSSALVQQHVGQKEERPLATTSSQEGHKPTASSVVQISAETHRLAPGGMGDESHLSDVNYFKSSQDPNGLGSWLNFCATSVSGSGQKAA